jgi:tRNA/tmRNA/rRNA uracil-C5-methylase (TrmA/RlmC/RlmD family)
VLADQLKRLAGVELDFAVLVEPLGSEVLGWRTRVQFAVDEAGRLGFHKHRSHEVVPVDRCLIAHPALRDLPSLDRPDGPAWPPGGAVEGVASSGGDVTVLMRQSRTDRRWSLVDGAPRVREKALGRTWSPDATSFWQVHPAAPDRFAAMVLEFLQPRAGERAWDLYGGAGLFAAALAPQCGPVTVVEADRRAVAAGKQALRDVDNVHFVAGDVGRTLANSRWRTVDIVVLDPPRAGAGREVVTAIVRRHPRAVAYVACDPAAFARDTRVFADLGYRLAALRAFDAFPMTHHFEAIGLFRPE